MIIWGMSFVWTNMLLDSGYPPMSIILIRITLVSVLMGGLFLLAGKVTKIRKGDFKLFLLMALFEPLLYFIGETYGIKITRSPTLASIMVSLIPLFGMAAGYFFFKERLTKNNIIGVFVSIIGVYSVLINDYGRIDNLIPGILLFLSAIISSVLYSVVIRRLTDSYNPYTLVVYQNLIGIFYFLPIVTIFERRQLSEVNVSLINAYPLLMLAILASGTAFLLFIYCIKNSGIAKTNMFVTLIPICTMIFSYFIGGEEITFVRTIGVVIAITGLILSQIPQKVSTDKKNLPV